MVDDQHFDPNDFWSGFPDVLPSAGRDTSTVPSNLCCFDRGQSLLKPNTLANDSKQGIGKMPLHRRFDFPDSCESYSRCRGHLSYLEILV